MFAQALGEARLDQRHLGLAQGDPRFVLKDGGDRAELGHREFRIDRQ